MTTISSDTPFARLYPDIEQAFAEWKVQARSPQQDDDRLGVVRLARRILDLQEQGLMGVTEERPLSCEQQTMLYKVFSRAAKVHFGLDERLFSLSERLAIVDLLLKLAPVQMVESTKHQMTLIQRQYSKIVINRLAWQLLLGIHFEERLLSEDENAIDLSRFDDGDLSIDAELLLFYLSKSIPAQRDLTDKGPSGLICLRTPRELALFFIYMESRGDAIACRQEVPADQIPWWPIGRGMYNNLHKGAMSLFLMATSPIEGRLCLDPIWSRISCPFVVSLSLEEFLHLYPLTTPAGMCVQAATAAQRVVVEDFSNFETYLHAFEGITDPKIWKGLLAKNAIFEVSEKELSVQLNVRENFSNGDGPSNRAFTQAATEAIAEYERFQKEPFNPPFSTLKCVTLTRQLVRIISPFLGNPFLECPLILAKDVPRLFTLIDDTAAIDVHSQAPILSEDERQSLRAALWRFCTERMLDETHCVRIEGRGGSVFMNKTLMMLLFREYSKGLAGVDPKAILEVIHADGLLEDGLEALSRYFQCPEGALHMSPRQALQVVSFFEGMSCEVFYGKEDLLENIYAKQGDLCKDPEVFNNSVLVGMLLTLLSDKVQLGTGKK